MEWSILFMGPVGAGKTEAIRSLSDIEVLDTDVNATDETALLKEKTTVSMDVGVLNLSGGDKLRLYGAPGQGRFDFMWEILVEHAKGLVIMLNHANPDPLQDLAFYTSRLKGLLAGRTLPVVVGITHTDVRADRTLALYQDYLRQHPVPFAAGRIPLFRVDARRRHDASALMMALAAMLEMNERLAQPVRA
jgi:signal recognition particle receptor subunit beta